MKTPKRDCALVGMGSLSLAASHGQCRGPKAKSFSGQGRRKTAESQCGTWWEISWSWNRAMMIPSRPKTPPAAIRPLE